MPPLPTYLHFGGVHPETAALANCLAAAGLRAPHTSQPFSEAMLLGLGGGLGAGYILWEFQEHQARVLVLGWRTLWQYPVRFLETACQRAGADAAVHETSGRVKARQHLQAALDAGTPPLAWVDRAHMPYLQLPEALKGHLGHLVAVAGQSGGSFLIDDLAAAPFRVADDDLAAARARIVSYSNRLLVPTPGPGPAPDLRAGLLAGLRDCADNLLGKSDSFSLPTFSKWAKMLTDKKNKKAWPVLFASPRGLYGLLQSVFGGIELENIGGGGLRGLYAAFLDEAAPLLDAPALSELAARYRALAERWSQLAEAALPDRVPAFHQAKALLRAKHARLAAEGEAAVEGVRPLTQELGALHAALNKDFPLDALQTQMLFTDLSDRLHALYAAEVDAARALSALTAELEGRG
jgi:hypothetical protein